MVKMRIGYYHTSP